MISGKPTLQNWYFNYEKNPEHRHNDLRCICEDYAVIYVHDILEKSIVEFENNIQIHDASDFLREVDIAILAISQGCQIPSSSNKFKCRFCGVGDYQMTTAIASSYSNVFSNTGAYGIRTYICNRCGHLDMFAWLSEHGEPPWITDDLVG